MAFVLITGGIDLSVGTGDGAGERGSCAGESAWRSGGAVLAGAGAGLAIGVLNGRVITHMRILPVYRHVGDQSGGAWPGVAAGT